jgi:hypothetical protein
MPKTKQITSIRDLARAMKLDEKSVRKYLADDRWMFKRTPPWPRSIVPKADTWRKLNLEQQPDGDEVDALEGLSAERKTKLRLIIERTAKVRLERELLAGKYLKRDDVEADLIGRASEAKQTLQVITGLAPRLVGKSEAEVRALLADHVDLVCRTLSTGKAA